jgi:hypothetical protein
MAERTIAAGLNANNQASGGARDANRPWAVRWRGAGASRAGAYRTTTRSGIVICGCSASAGETPTSATHRSQRCESCSPWTWCRWIVSSSPVEDATNAARRTRLTLFLVIGVGHVLRCNHCGVYEANCQETIAPLHFSLTRQLRSPRAIRDFPRSRLWLQLMRGVPARLRQRQHMASSASQQADSLQPACLHLLRRGVSNVKHGQRHHRFQSGGKLVHGIGAHHDEIRPRLLNRLARFHHRCGGFVPGLFPLLRDLRRNSTCAVWAWMDRTLQDRL